MQNTMTLIAADAYATSTTPLKTLKITNDADPADVSLAGIGRIELDFPKFTDGRAFSQAYLLRRRLNFTGEICATGDVLVDQLLQMQRSGFSTAVLRADQNLAHAERQLAHFASFYQGDAAQPQAHFAIEGATA
jgi:uncharacterized protein (DUF934 family)